jgi:hypothetical protein
VAGGTGIPGWNQPMHHMRGLILLSNGRLHGNSRKEKNQQGETEHARTETIHGQTPEYGLQVSNRRWLQSVIHITFHRNAICAPNHHLALHPRGVILSEASFSEAESPL